MMMRKLLTTLAIIGAIIVVVSPAEAVDLTNCSQLGLDNDPGCAIASENKLSTDNGGNTTAGVIRVALGALAGISIVVIVVGGFKFAISQGDQTQVKKARQTVLYAVVGLVVAISASVIVPYIINSLE
ncbi:hypothetical protein EUA66_00800 [TM7 phylum sp. oral taxon 349]|nr:hypothetical protein EUA66_00800 [TM7 phylum sp. oral taxon 349]